MVDNVRTPEATYKELMFRIHIPPSLGLIDCSRPSLIVSRNTSIVNRKAWLVNVKLVAMTPFACASRTRRQAPLTDNTRLIPSIHRRTA